MSWIFNTDFFSMNRERGEQRALNASTPLAAALMTHAQEGDVVYGDPTNFNIKDPYNDFDHGWDLDSDEFLGMR